MEFLGGLITNGASIYFAERNAERDRQEREAAAQRQYQLSLTDKATQSRLVMGLVAGLAIIGGLLVFKKAAA